MFLYWFSLVLTCADIVAIAGSVGLGIYLYMNDNLSDEGKYILAGIAIVCVILLPLIDMLRRKARTRSKYDKYGRMKQMSGYEKQSVQQQKEIDRIRMLEAEKLLPSTAVREMTKHGSSDPEGDLADMTGLEEIKEKVEEMEARMENERRNRKKGSMPSARHMVFFGPPGTGKTTVVSVMTAFLKKYGYIESNRFLQVNGSFFSGADAPAKMDAVCQHAFGGVLFIDEAYAVMQSPHGDETVSTLLSQMEDNRDKFVLIMAGYEKEMKDLLRANPGFLSRIAEFLYFRDYTPAELYQVFCYMAGKAGYSVSSDAEDKFLHVIRLSMQEASFGNARTCRSILDRAISKHSLRLKREHRKKDDFILTADDIVFEANPLAV